MKKRGKWNRIAYKHAVRRIRDNLQTENATIPVKRNELKRIIRNMLDKNKFLIFEIKDLRLKSIEHFGINSIHLNLD